MGLESLVLARSMGSKSRIAVCDAETDPFKAGRPPRDFVWGFYDGLDYDVFWGEDGIALENFMEFLSEYPNKLSLYAHNGGKFDFFYLLQYFDKGSIQLINGRISSATLFDGKITLRDSYNIIPVPQRYFGKDDIEYWKMERGHRNEHRAEILSYLQTDCFELYRIVTAFIDRFGRHLTLATVSMKLLKSIIEEKTCRKFERFNDSQDERFRPYYYGGRCQAFQKGELKPKSGRFKVYDINSAYPFAMLHKHPDPTYNSFYVMDYLPKGARMGPSFVHLRAISNGALPWRLPAYDNLTFQDKRFCQQNGVSLKRSEYEAGKLFFPDDNQVREYFVTGWEVQAGLDTGTIDIKKIVKVCIPDKIIDFSDFILPLYEERKEAKNKGDKVTVLFNKLLMNSSYGKFALNPREFKEYCFCEYGEKPPMNPNDKNPYIWFPHQTYAEYNLDIYERPKHIPKKLYDDPEIGLDPDDYRPPRGFYSVAVAASITGFVRAYLWRALCRSENAIYSDTDSIVCESFGEETGDELGQWDEEGQSDVAYIGGRKMYALRIVDGKGLRYWRDKDRVQYGIDVIRSEEVTEGRRWKIACKGARLNPGEIIRMVKRGETIKWANLAPTNSLRFGQRFLTRKVKMT